jgi:hypothetical protein
MKTTFFFQLCLNVVFAFLLLITGLALALSFITEHYYDSIFELLNMYPWVLPLIGVACVLVSYSILSWVLPLLRKGQFETVTGKAKILIEQGLVDKIVKQHLSEELPESYSSSYAFFKKNKLHITAHVKKRVSDDKLLELTAALRNKLYHELGYVGDFTLSLSA